MRICKRIVPAVLALLMILTMLPLQTFAAGKIDLEKESSLTISYQDNDRPLENVKFDIYLVATISETGVLMTTDIFKGFNVNIYGENDSAWRELASTLEGYVLRDEIAPTDSGRTDEDGKLIFPNMNSELAKGLYLVLGERHIQYNTIYEPVPFMVLIPSLDMENNDWNYDVTVRPKFESRPIPPEDNDTIIRKVLKVWEDKGHKKERPKEVEIQLLRDGKVYDTVILSAKNNWRYTWDDLDDDYRWTVVEKELDDYTVTVTKEGITFVVTNTYDDPETPPEKPKDPELPQTGQLWWPVPLLMVGGLVLIVVGLLRRRKGYEE